MATTKVDTTNVKLSDVPGVPDTKLMKTDKLAPATEFAASGAIIEPTIIERVDMMHPAVDNEPRKGQPVISNMIDFNDPTLDDADAVAANLKA